MATEGEEVEERGRYGERGGVGFDTRRAGVADLGILRKKGAARGGSVRVLNEAQLHSAAAIPSPSARVSCVRRRPNYPRTFSTAGRGGEEEGERGRQNGQEVGEKVTAEWSHLCNLRRSPLLHPRLLCTKKGSAEKGEKNTARAREQLTTLGKFTS